MFGINFGKKNNSNEQAPKPHDIEVVKSANKVESSENLDWDTLMSLDQAFDVEVGKTNKEQMRTKILENVKNVVEYRVVETEDGEEVRSRITEEGTERVRKIFASVQHDPAWRDAGYRRDAFEKWMKQPFGDEGLLSKAEQESIIEAMNRSFGAMYRYQENLTKLIEPPNKELAAVGLEVKDMDRITDPIVREQLVKLIEKNREKPGDLNKAERDLIAKANGTLASRAVALHEKREKAGIERKKTSLRISKTQQRVLMASGLLVMGACAITGLSIGTSGPESARAMEKKGPSNYELIETNMEKASPQELREMWDDYVDSGKEMEFKIIEEGEVFQAPNFNEVDYAQAKNDGAMPTPADSEALFMKLPDTSMTNQNDMIVELHNHYEDKATDDYFSYQMGKNKPEYIQIGPFIAKLKSSALVAESASYGEAIQKLGGEHEAPFVITQNCGTNVVYETFRLDNSKLKRNFDGYEVIGVMDEGMQQQFETQTQGGPMGETS